jgi:hypothetical protein
MQASSTPQAGNTGDHSRDLPQKLRTSDSLFDNSSLSLSLSFLIIVSIFVPIVVDKDRDGDQFRSDSLTSLLHADDDQYGIREPHLLAFY